VRVRLDRKATAIVVLLVVLGVREDGQKVLLAARNMGGETSEAWRASMLLRNGIGEPIPILVDQRFSGGFPLSEMTVDDFRRSFDGDPAPIGVCSAPVRHRASHRRSCHNTDGRRRTSGIAQGSALGRPSCSGARTGRSGFGASRSLPRVLARVG